MSETTEHPEVFVKCKRGSDIMTNGESCDSNRALKLSPDGSNNVSFRCLKCNHQWFISIGGSVNL
jgi:hypothetical protein